MGRPFDIPRSQPLTEQDGRTYPKMVALMRRLLAEDGCPWDREQTFTTLRKYLQEEVCEVLDALDSENREALREELGDLAFQIVFLAELAQREGAFGPDDVFRDLIEKLVRRHPHVFAETDLDTPGQVEKQWEMIKAEEKRNRPLLDNIPRALPALAGAKRLSDRAASVGFDWDDFRGSRAKIEEELAELDQAAEEGDRTALEHELGDVLFALVNYGRHVGIDAEEALRKTSDRFRSRFNHVEMRVKAVHGDWPREGTKAKRGVPLSELESYWQEAKKVEKSG